MGDRASTCKKLAMSARRSCGCLRDVVTFLVTTLRAFAGFVLRVVCLGLSCIILRACGFFAQFMEYNVFNRIKLATTDIEFVQQ